MRIRLLLAIFLISVFQSSHSQMVHMEGSPLGLPESTKSFKWFDPGISQDEINDIREGALENDGLLRFAVVRETDLNRNNSGIVSECKGDINTWHISISSNDAASLSLVFSSFELKENEKVFIYDPGMKNIMGPFTSLNNKESGILPVLPLEGSKLILEYQFLKKGGGKLEIGQIGHDALGVFGKPDYKDSAIGVSGPCNVDINCGAGDEWSIEKRAVVKLVITTTQFVYLGSGSLVNNTGSDNLAYILTAEHVIGNSYEANRTVAIFNYESPWCGGPEGSEMKSISSADLLASNPDIDFSLIELTEFPPILYKPYMAGWDATGNRPQSTWCIHHPSGDVKKISVDYDAPSTGTFEGNLTDGFWHILQWDRGTTEGGSSGSPLFDQNHKIVGTLTGGAATCGNSVNDYFAKLDKSFSVSTYALSSPKPWLDNRNVGTLTLGGRDPYASNFNDSDTLFNGIEDENYLTEYDGGGHGLTTGTNSDSILSYAERFYADGSKELTDIFLYVGTRNLIDHDDYVTFYVYDDNNGPNNILASATVNINEIMDDFLLRVDFENPVPVDGYFYIAYRNWYQNEADAEVLQFAVYHGSDPGPGSDYAWFLDQTGWYPFAQHPFDPGDNTLYIKAVVVETSTIVSVPTEKLDIPGIKIYPNPFSEWISIETADPNLIIQSASLMDLTGRRLRIYQKLNSTIFSLDDLAGLEPGIYLLDLLIAGQHQVCRIIKE